MEYNKNKIEDTNNLEQSKKDEKQIVEQIDKSIAPVTVEDTDTNNTQNKKLFMIVLASLATIAGGVLVFKRMNK